MTCNPKNDKNCLRQGFVDECVVRMTSIKAIYYIPSSEILEFPSVINFDIITTDDINFHFHFLP